MGLQLIDQEVLQNQESLDENGLPTSKSEMIRYDSSTDTTDKTYIVNGISVTEKYAGNVRDELLVGNDSLKPIEIKKNGVTFEFDKDDNGNEITIIRNAPEWVGKNINNKTYLGHIESMDECNDSNLCKVYYCNGDEESFFRTSDGVTYIHNSNGTDKYTKVSKDGKTYLFEGTVTDVDDPKNKLNQVIFKDGDNVITYDYTCKDTENMTIIRTLSPDKKMHVLCYKGYYKPDDELPSKDKLVRECYGNANSQELQVIDYKWDEQGRCISKLSSVYNGNQCATETCYEYDDNGGKIETNYSIGALGRRCLDSTKIYDSDGTLLKEYTPETYNPGYAQQKTEEIDVDSNGGKDVVTTYLDANGQVVREDIVLQNSVGITHGTMQRFYADGKLVCQKIDSNQSFDGDIDDAISRQGQQEDCWFLTEINDLQMRDPQALKNNIKLNPDGTVDVSLYLMNNRTNEREKTTVKNISIEQIKEAQEKGLLSKEGSDWDLLALEYALLQKHKEQIIPSGFFHIGDLTGNDDIDVNMRFGARPDSVRLSDGTRLFDGHYYRRTENENGRTGYINPYNNGVVIEQFNYDNSTVAQITTRESYRISYNMLDK